MARGSVTTLITATLRLLAPFALLAWSPAFAQTTCQSPPPGMTCPGDIDPRFSARRTSRWRDVPTQVKLLQSRSDNWQYGLRRGGSPPALG